MDKDKVEEAIRIIDLVMEDKEFVEWLEQKTDELTNDYDEYVHHCEVNDEEPEHFGYWALRKFVDE